ncbi:hypothetical protein DSO57_1005341 [Entomophthora muscae]|uniref:Uncharacterized protein n=1 Tax=Entomophthora muscae TaxID=34485 RepID=A0ACC2RMM8_9FUNG|nr:hypothetical protein DSO57_1005341 [Entomophthora muscae]
MYQSVFFLLVNGHHVPESPLRWWSPSDINIMTFSSVWLPPMPHKIGNKTGYVKLGKLHEPRFGFMKKSHEGYYWGKAISIPNSVVCPTNSTCTLVQNLPYSTTWKQSSNFSFTFKDVLVLTAPRIHPSFLASKATKLNSTVSLSFLGPKAARMAFYPLYWRTEGLFESIFNARGKIQWTSKPIAIHFPILDKNQYLFGRLSLVKVS